jgi:hypothetical protein
MAVPILFNQIYLVLGPESVHRFHQLTFCGRDQGGFMIKARWRRSRFFLLLVEIAVTAGLSWGAGPATTRIAEGLFGNRTGSDKKEATLTFVGAAVSATEAIASRDIVDEEKFRAGLGSVIDGVVQCLNASVWAKK